MARLWRYATGERGLNRIRVYERRPNGPIYVEWYDREGRHQQSLRTAAGLAKQLADVMAAAQRRKREAQTASTLLGLPEPRTLGELLAAYETAHPEWSKGHLIDQKANRRFWQNWLGEDVLLQDTTPDKVQGVMRKARAAFEKSGQPFGPRTQHKRLRYLKDAFTYAQVKLKWIGEADNLSALDAPASDGDGKPYSLEEVARLLPATRQIDLRCAVVATLAWVGGRRLSAIRTLPASSYRDCGDGYGEIQFPAATDKARRSGLAYVTGSSKALVEELLETPAVKATDLLFPAGKLSSTGKRRPLSSRVLTEMLRKAEKLAGVESIPGRAYHGLKRRFATSSAPLRSAASKQSGTSEQVLRDVYEKDDPAPKRELASYLDDLLKEAS
jgi:integrase